MNEKLDNIFEEKLRTIIEKAWKDYPPKEMDEHTFYVKIPSASWTLLSVGTKRLTNIDTPHFLWKTEMIVRGTSWEVVKYETPRVY